MEFLPIQILPLKITVLVFKGYFCTPALYTVINNALQKGCLMVNSVLVVWLLCCPSIITSLKSFFLSHCLPFTDLPLESVNHTHTHTYTQTHNTLLTGVWFFFHLPELPICCVGVRGCVCTQDGTEPKQRCGGGGGGRCTHGGGSD